MSATWSSQWSLIRVHPFSPKDLLTGRQPDVGDHGRCISAARRPRPPTSGARPSIREPPIASRCPTGPNAKPISSSAPAPPISVDGCARNTTCTSTGPRQSAVWTLPASRSAAHRRQLPPARPGDASLPNGIPFRRQLAPGHLPIESPRPDRPRRASDRPMLFDGRPRSHTIPMKDTGGGGIVPVSDLGEEAGARGNCEDPSNYKGLAPSPSCRCGRRWHAPGSPWPPSSPSCSS
jgi:hypothetical protein